MEEIVTAVLTVGKSLEKVKEELHNLSVTMDLLNKRLETVENKLEKRDEMVENDTD